MSDSDVYSQSSHGKNDIFSNGRTPTTKYLNEAEIYNLDIYDNFEVKKPFGLLFYMEIFERLKDCPCTVSFLSL